MKPIRVLVVEDSMIAQIMIKANLTQKGCTVDLADDALSALKKADSHHYDVILMDIGLGSDSDGFDVASHIKHHSILNKRTSIAVVSVHHEADYRDRAETVGMVGYFNKPFTPKDAEKVINAVQNKQLNQIVEHIA